MVKRSLNIFHNSSESESEDDNFKIIKRKPKKVLKITTTNESYENNDSTASKSNEYDEKDDEDLNDYMKFEIGNSIYEEDDKQYENLKYDDLQKVRREEALNQSLFKSTQHTTNKSIGLSIMEKMGFKVGDSLGQSSNNSGINGPINTPIAVHVKTDKLGIGAKTAIKTSYLQTEGATDEYRNRFIKTKEEARIRKIVNKMMKFCFEISGEADRFYNNRNEYDIHKTNPLWIAYVLDLLEKEKVNKINRDIVYIANEDGNEETEYKKHDMIDDLCNDQIAIPTASEQITLLSKYLRKNHLYCWYCGCYFENSLHLSENCPGVTEQDHLK